MHIYFTIHRLLHEKAETFFSHTGWKGAFSCYSEVLQYQQIIHIHRLDYQYLQKTLSELFSLYYKRLLHAMLPFEQDEVGKESQKDEKYQSQSSISSLTFLFLSLTSLASVKDMPIRGHGGCQAPNAYETSKKLVMQEGLGGLTKFQPVSHSYI